MLCGRPSRNLGCELGAPLGSLARSDAGPAMTRTATMPGQDRRPRCEDAMNIQLCGKLSVLAAGGDAAEALPGRQGRLLLAYLVTVRGEPVRRDALIDVVWQGQLPS